MDLERVSQGKKLAPVDQSKYLLVSEPEGEKAANAQNWSRAIDHANINFGYAENRRMNLELEREYGPTVW